MHLRLCIYECCTEVGFDWNLISGNVRVSVYVCVPFYI